MNVVAILLAAGSAKRFGSDKLAHLLLHEVPIAVQAATHAEAFVVALADMPFIRPSTIAAVREGLVAGAPLVAPYFRARRGHPVGIAAKFRRELEGLRGDEGAKKIIAANEAQLLKIPVGDPGVLRDIDTPRDLAPPAVV